MAKTPQERYNEEFAAAKDLLTLVGNLLDDHNAPARKVTREDAQEIASARSTLEALVTQLRAPKDTNMEITVRYLACGNRKTSKFKTLSGARKFALKWVGKDYELGGHYAVSADGVGTIRVEGVSLLQLLPERTEG